MSIQADKARLQDLRKLRRMLRLIPVDRKSIGEKLIDEIAFISQTLANLRKTITEKGEVDQFKQGKQEFLRESPALKAYNTTIQRYSLLYRQLTDLLPKPEISDKAADQLIEFIKAREGKQ
jgi:hypothetical protein